jgi:hypothetical protein
MSESQLTVDEWLEANMPRHCGLNADWSVTAWKLTNGAANRGQGLYLTDDENGNYSVVFRDFEGEDSASVTLATFPADRLAQLLPGYLSPSAELNRESAEEMERDDRGEIMRAAAALLSDLGASYEYPGFLSVTVAGVNFAFGDMNDAWMGNTEDGEGCNGSIGFGVTAEELAAFIRVETVSFVVARCGFNIPPILTKFYANSDSVFVDVPGGVQTVADHTNTHTVGEFIAAQDFNSDAFHIVMLGGAK